MTTLPDSLVRFRSQLEAAIEREQAVPAHGRRRPALRVALATAVAAAIVGGALVGLPGGHGGALVEPASAAARAASALAAAPGSTVHVRELVEQTGADGSRTTWREESWQETSPPYDRRQVVTDADGHVVQNAAVPPQAATSQPFRDQVLQLLQSGKLTQTGRVTVDGRPALSFTWNDGRTRYDYTVAAGTYAPLRWQLVPLDSPASATTVTFEVYEVLADR